MSRLMLMSPRRWLWRARGYHQILLKKCTVDGWRTSLVHDDDQMIQSCTMQVDVEIFERLIDRKWYGSSTVLRQVEQTNAPVVCPHVGSLCRCPLTGPLKATVAWLSAGDEAGAVGCVVTGFGDHHLSNDVKISAKRLVKTLKILCKVSADTDVLTDYLSAPTNNIVLHNYGN